MSSMAEVDIQDDEAKWRELWDQERFAEAEVILERLSANEKKPGLTALYLSAARSLRTKDRKYIDDAARRARRRVQLDLVFLLHGLILWKLGHELDGVRLLLKAGVENPCPDNVERAAVCLERIGCDSTAIALYDTMLDKRPDSANALVGRGSAKEGIAMRLLEEAERDFDAAITADAQNSAGWYEKGNLLAYQGEYKQGLDCFQRAMELGHHCPEAANAGVAFCLMKLGRPEEALEFVRKSLATDPEYEYAKNLLADIERLINRPDQ